MEKVEQKLNIIFDRFNTLPPLDPQIGQKAAKSFVQTGTVSLVQFACPNIIPEYLKSNEPENYVDVSSYKNNFEKDIPRFKKLVSVLIEGGFPTRLDLVIGDTDEEDYVFPVLGRPTMDNDQIEQNKETYKRQLVERIRGRLNELGIYLTGMEVCQVSEIVELMSDEIPEPNDQDLISLAQQEAPIMADIFNYYYQGVYLPSPDQLIEVSRLKVRSYARQGFTLPRFFSDSVFLQNEFPPQLRTEMLNLINRPTDQSVSALYLYGFSKKG